jgi:spore photoproduct lyase
MLRVKYAKCTMLDGSNKEVVQKVSDGSIITRFDKTPVPEEPTDVVCPHFMELKWANGCPYNCAWCYLQGTFRFTGKQPRIKDHDKILQHVKTFLDNGSQPEILNTGELADSLLSEGTDDPFSKFIIPTFEKQNKHKILFLTKSTDVKNLLKIDKHDTVIMSFSMNALPVAARWEKAPDVEDRIKAAKKVADAGYEVRIRIDPMVPVFEWEEHYVDLVDRIFRSFMPERITFGSLRGLQSTINNSSDRSWVRFLSERSNWGKKIDADTRYAMYKRIIDHLGESYGYRNVALCKETVDMWNRLGMDYRKIRCNCVW